MAEKTLYSKNPITEALIDIQLDQMLTVTSSELKLFTDSFKDAYPQVQERQMVETTFQLAEGKPVQSQIVSIEGYECWNQERNEVIQARKNGFSFSRLKPYQSWEEHFPKAMIYWDLYRKNFANPPAKRLAVRFINLFKIVESRIELADFLKKPPEIPSGLPQELDGFLYRVVVPFDSATKAIITMTPGNPAAGGAIEIVLDIDVFAITQVPFVGDFHKIFEKLHNYAENIFEAYITDKTRGLIK